MALKVPKIALDLTSDTCNTLDNARACAQRVLKPSCETFYSLKQWLSRCSSPWIQEFIRHQGLSRLIDTLELISQDRQNGAGEEWTSISDAVLQLDCIGCIREVLNHRHGLEFLLQNPQLITKLVLAIDTPNNYPKKQLFEILSCVAMVTRSGHQSVLKALEVYKALKHQAHRFTVILHELKLAENAHYRTTLVCFVNALVMCETELRKRCHIRDQLVALKLLDVLNYLKKEDLDTEYAVQVKTFYEQKTIDELELSREHYVNYASTHALFEAINNQVTDRLEAASFLHVLQDMHSIQSKTGNSVLLWKTLETISNQVLHMQSESEAEIFLKKLTECVNGFSSRGKSSVKPCRDFSCQADFSPYSCDIQTYPGLIRSDNVANNCDKITVNDDFGEIDNALKAILRTTDDLNKNNPEKEDRRDSGISIRSGISSPFHSRQNSHDNSEVDIKSDIKITGRSSLGGSGRLKKLPSISENRYEKDNLSVFEKAANVMRSRKVDFSTCQKISTRPESVKLSKTKFTKVAPLSLDNAIDSRCIWSQLPDYRSCKTELDYKLLQTEFKDDLNANLRDPEYEVQLLSDETSLSLNVLLARLETTAECVAECVRQGDMQALGAHATRRLFRALPIQQHVDLVLSYTSTRSMYDLGQAEQLLVLLAGIPDYRLKLQAAVFNEDFKAKVGKLRKSLDDLVNACRQIMQSERMREFMSLVLDAVNFLNRGSHIKNMRGITLDSLCSLLNTVSQSGSSLLHHVIKQVNLLDSPLMGFAEDISTLENGTKHNVEDLKHEVAQLTVKLKQFMTSLQNGQTATRLEHEAMIEDVKAEIQRLQEQIGALKTLSNQLSTYFCVLSEEFDLQRCLKQVHRFLVLAKQINKENKDRETFEKLANSKLQALGAQHAEQYFADIFADSESTQQHSKLGEKRLRLIDTIIGQLHQGKVTPNFLGEDHGLQIACNIKETECTPPRKMTKPNAQYQDEKEMNITTMFDFLEKSIEANAENRANLVKKTEDASNCTYEVKSPRAVNLSRTKPKCVSCEPVTVKDGMVEEQNEKFDITGAFELIVEELDLMNAIDNKPLHNDNDVVCDKYKDVIDEAKWDDNGKAACLEFNPDKSTPEKELSWDGFLPLQYTPGKQLFQPVQSTPAKENESLLVIPDMRPLDGRMTFPDKADVFITSQYRKKHQMASSSYLLQGKAVAQENANKPGHKTGTFPVKLLSIKDDQSIELDREQYDKTVTTPYDNVKDITKKKASSQREVDGGRKITDTANADNVVSTKILTTCIAQENTTSNEVERVTAPHEHKDSDDQAHIKEKSKPVSKLGILKRFSKAMMRPKQSVSQKKTEISESKHRNVDTISLDKKQKVVSGNVGLTSGPNCSSYENRQRTDSLDSHLSSKSSKQAKGGVIKANLFTSEVDHGTKKNKEQLTDHIKAGKNEPQRDNDGFMKPAPVPFKRQNALPVRSKPGSFPTFTRLGTRNTMPQSKREEQTKSGSQGTEGIVIKRSYKDNCESTAVLATNNVKTRNQRPTSLTIKPSVAKSSQVLGKQNKKLTEKTENENGDPNEKFATMPALKKTNKEIYPKSRKADKENLNPAYVKTSKDGVTLCSKLPLSTSNNLLATNRFGFTGPSSKTIRSNPTMVSTKSEIAGAKTRSLNIYKKY